MTDFGEQEKIVGYFTTHSGSIVIADGVHADSFSGSANQRVVLDLGKEEACKIPVYAAKQNEHRFLLIPIDAAVLLPDNQKDTVKIEDPVDVPPDEDEASK